ncbi:hypothetical protein LINGRAHAP2_LOCUS30581 [Linum grandiflorum]
MHRYVSKSILIDPLSQLLAGSNMKSRLNMKVYLLFACIVG